MDKLTPKKKEMRDSNSPSGTQPNLPVTSPPLPRLSLTPTDPKGTPRTPRDPSETSNILKFLKKGRTSTSGGLPKTPSTHHFCCVRFMRYPNKLN